MNIRKLRSFFSLIICLQLLLVQNIVLAEGEDPEIPEVPVVTTVESDANGFNEENQTYSLRNKVDISNSDILTQLTTMSAVMIGSSVALNCKPIPWDSVPFMAGAAAYLVMIIVSNKDLKDDQSAGISALVGNEENDLAVLNTLKDGENDRLKATKLKLTANITFSATLLVSEILAIVSAIMSNTPWTAAFNAPYEQVDCQGFANLGPAMGLVTLLSGLAGGTGAETGMGVLSAALMAVNLIWQNMSFSLVSTSVQRAIWYGIMLGGGIANTAVTAKKKNEIQDNISDIEKMISDYEAQVRQENVIEGEGDNTNNNVNSPTYTVPDTDGPIAGGDNEIPADVRNLNIPTVKVPNLISSPTLTQAIGDINRMGRSIKSGSYKGVLAAADSLNNSIGKLKKIKSDLVKKLNDKRKKEGSKLVDFAGQIKKGSDKLASEASKAINSSLGSAPALSKKEETKSEEVKKGGGSQAGSDIAIGEGGGAGAQKAMDENLFSEEDWSSDEDLVASASQEKSLDDYVLSRKDIHKDSSKSIFGLLSVRYLKSAYPKLLEEQK